MKKVGGSGDTGEFISLRLLHSSFRPSPDHSPGGLIRFEFVAGFDKQIRSWPLPPYRCARP
jgi:hypothetical protein